MILDTSILIDVLRGKDEAVRIIEENTNPKIPAAVLFELYAGGGREKEIEELREKIPRIDISPEDEKEAAEIRKSRENDGNPISSVDYLIAGTARNRGEKLATADSHFERIERLEVESY